MNHTLLFQYPRTVTSILTSDFEHFWMFSIPGFCTVHASYILHMAVINENIDKFINTQMLDFVNEKDEKSNVRRDCGRKQISMKAYQNDDVRHEWGIGSVSQVSLHQNECNTKEEMLRNNGVAGKQDNNDIASDVLEELAEL